MFLRTKFNRPTPTASASPHSVRVGCVFLFFRLFKCLQPEGKEGSYIDAFAPDEEVTAGLEFTALWGYDDGTGVTEVSHETLDTLFQY